MRIRRPRRFALQMVVIVAICLGTIQAANAYSDGGYNPYEIFYTYICLPNVRKHGQLSWRFCKQSRCKVVKNYYSGKCYAICHGYVKNFSRYPQHYYNIGLIPPYSIEGCKFKKDAYWVSYEGYRKGKARGIAWGYLTYYGGYGENGGGENGPT